MKKLFQTLALVSLATAGMIVSSCEVENIKTTFEPSPAVTTVTVTVYDIANGSKDVSGEAKITTDINSANVSINGNVITITGTPAISAQKFNVFASLGNSNGSTPVSISAVLAGGQADYAATVLIGEIAKDYECVYLTQEISIDYGTFFSTHGKDTYTHDYKHATTGHGVGRGKWLYNETEFILKTSVDYESITGVSEEYSSCKIYDEATDNDIPAILAYYDAYLKNAVESETKTLNIKVSAYAMYSAYGKRVLHTDMWIVNRLNSDDTKTKIGYLRIANVETTAEYCEAAMPGHEGHYVHGHGHDDVHGYSSNAGGGIMWTE